PAAGSRVAAVCASFDIDMQSTLLSLAQSLPFQTLLGHRGVARHETKCAPLGRHGNKAPVDLHIVGGHALRSEALLEAPPHATAIECQQSTELAHGFLLILHHEAG